MLCVWRRARCLAAKVTWARDSASYERDEMHRKLSKQWRVSLAAWFTGYSHTVKHGLIKKRRRSKKRTVSASSTIFSERRKLSDSNFPACGHHIGETSHVKIQTPNRIRCLCSGKLQQRQVKVRPFDALLTDLLLPARATAPHLVINQHLNPRFPGHPKTSFWRACRNRAW